MWHISRLFSVLPVVHSAIASATARRPNTRDLTWGVSKNHAMDTAKVSTLLDVLHRTELVEIRL